MFSNYTVTQHTVTITNTSGYKNSYTMYYNTSGGSYAATPHKGPETNEKALSLLKQRDFC